MISSSYQKQKKQSGFTIIEVLIVLAIAGLILLIVFTAVPALQRNSRDNHRKNSLTQVAALMEEYKRTYNDRYPDSTTIAQFNTLAQQNNIKYPIFINTLGYTTDCEAYFANLGVTDNIAITYPNAATSGTSYILAIRLEAKRTICVGNATN